MVKLRKAISRGGEAEDWIDQNKCCVQYVIFSLYYSVQCGRSSNRLATCPIRLATCEIGLTLRVVFDFQYL